MVLQILADAGRVADDADSQRLELRTRSDARQHQNLRRLERARAEDDLLPDAIAPALPADNTVDADDGPPLIEDEPLHRGTGDDVERRRRRLVQPCTVGAAPFRSGVVHIVAADDAGEIAVVHAVLATHADGGRGVQETLAERRRCTREDPEALLDRHEGRLHVRPAPSLGPSVEVAPVPARIDHAVDATATAEPPTGPRIQGPPTALRLHVGHAMPHQVVVGEGILEAVCRQRLGMAGRRVAGLQQQHRACARLCQARGDDAAGGAPADHNIVMDFFGHALAAASRLRDDLPRRF